VGWVLWKQGKYGEAEPFLRIAALNIPKTYGPTYRGVRIATSSLAHELNSLRQARAAESTARQALAMYRQAPTDRGVPNALIALSHALIAQRRGNEAVPYLREAMETLERYPQARYAWFKGEAQSTLGSVLAAQGHASEAEKLLLAGYEDMKDLPSTPPPRERTALERIASFYAASGKSDQAALWRGRLQEFDRVHFLDSQN
jgi:tetratricopeptide (TPR) repeat protein